MRGSAAARQLYTPNAGMGPPPKRTRHARRSGTITRELGQRQQQHVKGVGVLRGKYKRTPKAIIFNKRIHQNEPITVTHEVKQELRSNPGSQAVVTALAERRLPEPSYTGKLLTFVNRDSALVLQPFNRINKYTGAASDAPSSVLLNHREDWSMFTNGSWRDGMAFANGQLNTQAITESGYTTPFESGTALSYGTPSSWYEQQTLVLDTTGATRDATVTTNPDSASAIPGLATTIRNYYHLYEEIQWKITNPSITGTNVTIYECVLTRDIPIELTRNSDAVNDVRSNWGGLPCPLELWRQSLALRTMKVADLTSDGDPLQTNFGEGGQTASEVEGVGKASAALGANPTTGAASQGMTARDIDYPNVTPHKAALLHSYYKVIPHSKYIPPGASTTITIGVKYNKRIPGTWWNTLYGVAGMTRCFFMVSRPDEVVGVTGGDENPTGPIDPLNRLPVMNATDLMITWKKKKAFAKTKQRARFNYYFKSAIPEIDDVAVRNLVTGTVHDANFPMGALAEEGVQMEQS